VNFNDHGRPLQHKLPILYVATLDKSIIRVSKPTQPPVLCGMGYKQWWMVWRVSEADWCCPLSAPWIQLSCHSPRPVVVLFNISTKLGSWGEV